MTPSHPRNGVATRERILSAARAGFAAGSYDAVSLRDVAREAGVDVALVSRYFGSKEELFQKVLLERTGGEWFGGKAHIGEVAEWLADLAIGDDDLSDRDDIKRLYIILRSASSSATARMVRDAFLADVFAPLCRLLGGEDAETRAALALSIVIGATVLRGITRVDPLSEAQRRRERSELLRLIQDAFSPRTPP